MKNLKKLSRNDLKSISGGKLYGGGTCAIKVITVGNGFGSFETDGFTGSCSNQSSQASVYCAELINQHGYTKCSYDCACDGYGH